MALPLKGLVVSAATVAVALPASAQASTAVVRATPEPGHSAVLSNERTSTLSARVLFAGIIRQKPSKTARAAGRLRQLTEDGYPEVYLALRAYTDMDGVEWTKIRIPGRPNGRVGWVTRDLLGTFRQTRWQIVVNRRTLHMTVLWNGKKRWRRPVGIGTPHTPTPAGRFWIREKIRVRDKTSPYWPYALGTANYSTLSEWPGGGVVGIHGDWNQPALIPGRPSHGCIRMHDRDVAWLARHVPVGTPLRVLG
ncbi:MAG TPA: L,D-transpeptidase [Thermoleophilaceae bacterium]